MTRTIEDILGKDAVAKVRQPIELARGLPAAAYTSDEFYALEQERLFPQSWMGVAFADDIPETGDAIPITASGLPIVIVRNRKGEVRAFHNVCRHRATLVVREPAKRLSNLQCPYHAWTYGLDGILQATPYFDGTKSATAAGVDKSVTGLVPVRCGVWNHVVFVNIDGNAPPLEEYVRPAAELLASFDLDSLKLGHTLTWEFNANWKMIFDNWEVYHHVWVHKGVFDRMSDEVDMKTGKPHTEMIATGDILILKANAKRPPRRPKAPALKHALPPIPARQGAKPAGGAAIAVLPNTTVTMSGNEYAPAIFTPLAPGRTRASMAWYYVGDAATDRKYADARKRALDRWLGETRRFEDRGGIRSQDHSCMELQQAARSSPVADDVRFSPTWETNVHYFQGWLVDHLQA